MPNFQKTRRDACLFVFGCTSTKRRNVADAQSAVGHVDHAYGESAWRSMDFGPVSVYLLCDVLRVSCPEHGVVTAIDEDLPIIIPAEYHGPVMTSSKIIVIPDLPLVF